jgi:hypothetical protein
MPVLIMIAIALWFLFGDPKKVMANWFFESEAAPWETVDAFYYPSKMDLSIVETMTNFESVDACRSWVYIKAAVNNDSSMERGDYECGVGFLESSYGLSVYRLTVR